MESILDWYRKPKGVIFKGRLGLRQSTSPAIRSSREGTVDGRRHGVGSGFLHEGPYGRVRGSHQVRRQDPARGQDGHPRRGSPGHHGVHQLQGGGGERKAWTLIEAGIRRLSLDGAGVRVSVFFQNANNSCAGARRVHANGCWTTANGDTRFDHRRATSSETFRAKAHDPAPHDRGRRPICAATRACSSTPPSTTGTRAPNTAPHQCGSNPCSEYMHLDNSACNLASLNLHASSCKRRRAG